MCCSTSLRWLHNRPSSPGMSDVISLHAGDLNAKVQPARGGTLQHLQFRQQELLAQMPWKPQPFAEMMDEDAWVRSWSGGWQLLVPNAGSAAQQAEPPQGFHGNASISAWQGEKVDAACCNLHWQAGPISVSRSIRLENNTVGVTTAIKNNGESPYPFIATEHAIFGEQLLASAGKLHCAAETKVAELGYDGSPGLEPAQPWDDAGLTRVVAGLPARLFVISKLDARGIGFTVGRLSVRLRWDTSVLPFAWLWQEVAATAEEPWNRRVRALGIEPSTTDHGLGLDYELKTRRPKEIPAGGTVRWWVSLEVTEGAGNG